jgi:predicted SnoaL-like aldol condensation-catalyzing enzyme
VKAALGDEALTARNKEVVRNFYTTVLIGRDVDAEISEARLHSTQSASAHRTDRIHGHVSHAFCPTTCRLNYKRELLNVIGENDMVVVYVRQTWTSSKDGQHHQALGFDMFRVQDGMIAEHWDAH